MKKRTNSPAGWGAAEAGKGRPEAAGTRFLLAPSRIDILCFKSI